MRKFRDIAAFQKFMRDVALPSLPAAVHRGVSDGAHRICVETQVQLGQYLIGSEPGLPTAHLADRTIDERIRLGYAPDDPGLRSGEMRDSYGARVSEPALRVEASIGSDEEKAVVFELGRMSSTNYQPPRPELSIAAIRNQDRVTNGLARVVVRALEGRPLPNIDATDDDAAR